jgi:hypothetical protein
MKEARDKMRKSAESVAILCFDARRIAMPASARNLGHSAKDAATTAAARPDGAGMPEPRQRPAGMASCQMPAELGDGIGVGVVEASPRRQRAKWGRRPAQHRQIVDSDEVAR